MELHLDGPAFAPAFLQNARRGFGEVIRKLSTTSLWRGSFAFGETSPKEADPWSPAKADEETRLLIPKRLGAGQEKRRLWISRPSQRFCEIRENKYEYCSPAVPFVKDYQPLFFGDKPSTTVDQPTGRHVSRQAASSQGSSFLAVLTA
jgi:hypothetical protein